MTLSHTAIQSDRKKQQYLEIAVPLLSFGVTLIGVLLWQMGMEINFQFFSFGCVLGSCILAYLAWIRPKKDIVALSTPIYAFIFFVVPTDFISGLSLQLLYALSLTLLLIRLKYRFGTCHTAVSRGQELAVPLKTYIGKTCDAFTGISSEPAHRAAVVISQFSTGEYGQAAHAAGSVAGQETYFCRKMKACSQRSRHPRTARTGNSIPSWTMPCSSSLARHGMAPKRIARTCWHARHFC